MMRTIPETSIHFKQYAITTEKALQSHLALLPLREFQPWPRLRPLRALCAGRRMAA